MFDAELNAIKTALSGVFDRVLDIFDGINMPEHRNETLCFVGIGGYKLLKPVYGGAAPCELSFTVQALGKRTMSAAELSALFDGYAVAAIEGCGLSVDSIKREACTYSKEQQRHKITAEVKVISSLSAPSALPAVELTVGEEVIGGMDEFKIERKISTGETPTIDSGIKTRVIGEKPTKITVKGNASRLAAAGIYSKLCGFLGGQTVTVSLAGISFAKMMLTELSLYGSDRDFSGITAEFSGVNEP